MLNFCGTAKSSPPPSLCLMLILPLPCLMLIPASAGGRPLRGRIGKPKEGDRGLRATLDYISLFNFEKINFSNKPNKVKSKKY
jgi:hypothetical protein